jgi:hypothetical protein
VVDYFLSVLNGIGGSWVLGRSADPLTHKHIAGPHPRFEFVGVGGHVVLFFRGNTWPDGVFEVWNRHSAGIVFDVGDHEQVVKATRQILVSIGAI